jgi:hypothetical protein
MSDIHDPCGKHSFQNKVTSSSQRFVHAIGTSILFVTWRMAA